MRHNSAIVSTQIVHNQGKKFIKQPLAYKKIDQTPTEAAAAESVVQNWGRFYNRGEIQLIWTVTQEEKRAYQIKFLPDEDGLSECCIFLVEP